jgi:hypothetical protein
MPPRIRAVLIWIIAIFLVYAVVTSPEKAADVVEAVWGMITNAFASFGRFFSSLTS